MLLHSESYHGVVCGWEWLRRSYGEDGSLDKRGGAEENTVHCGWHIIGCGAQQLPVMRLRCAITADRRVMGSSCHFNIRA
jgi:hypothetical protein